MVHENSAGCVLKTLPIWRQCSTVADNIGKSDQAFWNKLAGGQGHLFGFFGVFVLLTHLST